jgi:gentisate 1,2-dioxygenase
MEAVRHQELNRPSSLETVLRDDFYSKQRCIKMRDVALEPLAGTPGVRHGWYAFGSGVVAWGLSEMDPGAEGPVHRQSCESTMFVLEGEGYTLVNGQRFDWAQGDVLFVPLFAWHQHVNTGQATARYLRMSTAPLFHYLGVYRGEPLSPPTWERAAEEAGPLGKVLLKRDEWMAEEAWRAGGEGHTVMFPFDYRIPTTKGVPSRIPPGQKGNMHRHASEAQIFIYQGRGYSTLNDVRVDWEAGDVIRVPLFAWHQHTNTGDVPTIHLKHTSANLYNRLGMLMRDAKPGFDGDVSAFEDDFKPY